MVPDGLYQNLRYGFSRGLYIRWAPDRKANGRRTRQLRRGSVTHAHQNLTLHLLTLDGTAKPWTFIWGYRNAPSIRAWRWNR